MNNETNSSSSFSPEPPQSEEPSTQSLHTSDSPIPDLIDSTTLDSSSTRRFSFWSRAVTFAGLLILGVTPWAQAQLPAPNRPALCPPLTSIATPSLFDLFWGTTPIRFPYQ